MIREQQNYHRCRLAGITLQNLRPTMTKEQATTYIATMLQAPPQTQPTSSAPGGTSSPTRPHNNLLLNAIATSSPEEMAMLLACLRDYGNKATDALLVRQMRSRNLALTIGRIDVHFQRTWRDITFRTFPQRNQLRNWPSPVCSMRRLPPARQKKWPCCWPACATTATRFRRTFFGHSATADPTAEQADEISAVNLALTIGRIDVQVLPNADAFAHTWKCQTRHAYCAIGLPVDF